MTLDIKSPLKLKSQIHLDRDPRYGLFGGYPYNSLDSNYQSVKVRPEEAA